MSDSNDGAWTLLNNIGDTLRSRGFGPDIGPLDERVIAMAKELDDARSRLAFAKEKGLVIGKAWEGGKPPVFAYVVASGSDLDDMPTLKKLQAAEAEIARLKGG